MENLYIEPILREDHNAKPNVDGNLMGVLKGLIKIDTGALNDDDKEDNKKFNEDELDLLFEDMVIGEENPDKFEKMNVGNTGVNAKEIENVEIGIISEDKQKSDDI